MGRRQKPVFLPAWVLRERDFCLQATAEDAYVARQLALDAGAPHSESCGRLLRAAEKSLRRMESARIDKRKRCAEGDRAARKFLEAKTCARRMAA